MLVFALGGAESFPESLNWSLGVIIFKVETGAKTSTGTGTGNKDKLRVKAKRGTNKEKQVQTSLEQKNNH
ncbi:hypothetical protein CP360_06885 [Lactobacillus sp. UMNPBX9]|nr:hypothetical protein CP360_06885 [Lactobacillus sp. UMNPBX9]